MIQYKAEEADCDLIVLNTRKSKPSQRDPVDLNRVVKKTLAKRTHTLPDGRVIGRDHAAALVMLRLGLNSLGREPSWVG
jgi:putative transposase